jgi:hypothetical protein
MSSRFIRYAVAILIAILLQACGGGGGGGGTSGATTPATPSTLVSGNVQAPGGQVALLEQSIWTTRLASIFISASYADVIGLAKVSDGTVVELVRVDPVTGAAPGAPLATTSVSAGRYSFNLTSLGLDYSTTLQARLGRATGIQMRTFVTGAVANLDPNSEAGIQLVLESIAAKPGSSLTVMTIKDLDDVAASIDMLTSAAGVAAGTTTASTVNAIKSALNARPELSALLNTKLTAGHAATGPGDLANYFPLATGDTWTYSVSENGAPPASAEIVAVGAAIPRNGATVMPLSNGTTTFPLPSPGGPAPVLTDTDFYLKDASGLISFGNSTDPAGITAARAPSYLELKLPARVGDTWIAVDKTGSFDLGQDLDGDGISETLTRVKLDKLVTGYQSITVPAGSFRCMVVENHVLVTIVLSASKVSVTAKSTITWFLAPDVGIVRIVKIADGSSSNGAVIPQSTSQSDLVDATIAGVSVATAPPASTKVKTVFLLHNDLAYDKTRNLLYASIPGQVANGNSIAVINPDTGAIVQTIPVGSEPLRLALSKGNEYLYVGLDGSGEIARINLTTMAFELKFSLGSIGNPPFSDQLFAGDIAVLPNNPLSIVVSEKVKVSLPSFAGIAVFDGAVKRTNEIQGFVLFSADSVAISDDNAFVYGMDNQSSDLAFTRFTISPAGISFLDQTNGLTSGFMPTRIRFYSGRLYLANGRVIDPVNKLLLGIYQLGGTSLEMEGCIPDILPARTYCLASSESPSTVTLVSFDQVLFTKLATVDTKLPAGARGLGTMVRFGARGFGVGARTAGLAGSPFDKIYLISSDIAL